ncbi:hypothetical protein [Bradyrhizobium sp. SZCCHNS3052]|uniref:hypothetical protein n=1 Tax=Bradyrhizobium sp. SZCCHNS3052 TaxID=3057321 RepID=UPI0029160919|nr:hypothetical protein [Bradyrhizobium sp. SZCCHNS3052]
MLVSASCVSAFAIRAIATALAATSSFVIEDEQLMLGALTHCSSASVLMGIIASAAI